MKIAYFRIIGNDLPPRHVKGQSLLNLTYQLDNEPEFDEIDKFWVINRILDSAERDRIISILTLRGKSFYEIDINPETYAKQTTFDQKVNYLTNVNGARNFCIDCGFNAKYDVVLPFDGNCFFTLEGWLYARNSIASNFLSPYFIFPMARCKSYDDLAVQPQIKELYTMGNMKRHDLTEPQIGFGVDYDLKFNENFPYGKASKIELLWRLGIPGIWEFWYPKEQAAALQAPSEYATRQPVYAGYVFRLPSGNVGAESNNVIRGEVRSEGLVNLVKEADSLLL